MGICAGVAIRMASIIRSRMMSVTPCALETRRRNAVDFGEAQFSQQVRYKKST